MKKWQKVLSIGVATAFLGAVTVGCGGGQNQSNQSAPSGSGQNAAKGTLQAIKDRGKLVAGVKYDTNLFGLKDPQDNQVKGFDIDIAREVAKDILGDPNKIELKEVTSKTRIPMLKNGDIDMIVATMTITEDRKKEVDFSDVYFKAGQSLLVKKDSPIKGIQDLDGKTVIAVKGSTSTNNIRAKAPKANVTEYENYAEAFTALKSGKGDALTTDNAILLGMQQQDPNFKLVGGLFTDEPYGIAVRKGDKEMVDEVNKVLKKLHDSGDYDKIYEKWFKEKPQQ
ncbi:glutamate ABC transporter substrate-binding protein [Effusibacillus dendaii]|uniref:Glutamine ABC transporter substrate-binding protein n=1 Tax=Effusibacillus dendaii TaxID=2743772 RepID=A0A7I8D821_9BACL|nr:glutamate ABC transporter substrate-binding protein [Effusibacillus dendaii]BCJ86157.1 glutamine ABC transporter substrate-binding protein [Effusibacillus dendaii]